MAMTYFLITGRYILPLSDGLVSFQVLSDHTCSSNQFKQTETTENHGCPLVHALLPYLFVCLTIWKAGAGKMINKMYALSKWMWPLSHGDVTFQQEAKDEMLSEDFVPPGCMAECWVHGCWPRHSITSAFTAAAAATAALRWGLCPSLTYISWQNSGAAHETSIDH